MGTILYLSIILLCSSALAFLALKLLGFFKLSLPFLYDGGFGKSNRNKGFQRPLVDCSLEKNFCPVHLSVKGKFPFDTTWPEDQSCRLNLKFTKKDSNIGDGSVELEGQGSCCFISDAKDCRNSYGEEDSIQKSKPGDGFGSMNSSAVKGVFNDKGDKGARVPRPRSGLRRRRKRTVDNGIAGLVTAYKSSPSDVQSPMQSTSSIGNAGDRTSKEIMIKPVTPERDGFQYSGDDFINFEDRFSHSSKWNTTSDNNKRMEKDRFFFEEFRYNACDGLGFDGNDENGVRFSEQASDKEEAVCAALHLELEKERSAAATAADEAMAMISRLQREKSSVELDARQYQRVMEEKIVYDAEEMDILKEMLLRRETEKRFLEKEVEAYRKLLFPGDEQLESGGHVIEQTEGRRVVSSSLNSTKNPILMLHRLSESIGSMEEVNNAVNCQDYEVTPVKRQNCIISFGKETPSPGSNKIVNVTKEERPQRQMSFGTSHPSTSRPGNEYNQFQEFQEKGIVYMDGTLRSPKEFNLLKKTITPLSEIQEQHSNAGLCQGNDLKAGGTHNGAAICIANIGKASGKNGKDLGQGSKDTQNPVVDNIDPCVLDVHVIDDDESNSCDATPGVSRKYEFPFEAFELEKPHVTRSNSAVPSALHTLANSHGNGLLSETYGRNSSSALEVADEKLKIVSEVGWLKERLRIVREEREKLNFSIEHRERENVYLRLLEDIASQVCEIRQLTVPQRDAARQASLPPPSSKVLSKKRLCRSASLGVQRSI